MPTSEKIIKKLVARGVIPIEHSEDAVAELDRELRRRSLRVAQKLARYATRQTFMLHLAEVTCIK